MEGGAGREGTGGLALGELFAEAFRLVLVGGGEDDVVPAGEGFAGQGAGVVFPGVLEGLGEEEGRERVKKGILLLISRYIHYISS